MFIELEVQWLYMCVWSKQMLGFYFKNLLFLFLDDFRLLE